MPHARHFHGIASLFHLQFNTRHNASLLPAVDGENVQRSIGTHKLHLSLGILRDLDSPRLRSLQDLHHTACVPV